jgi:predicted nucleic acid-binding protein
VRGFAARRAVLNAGAVADGRSAGAATAIAAAVTRRVTRLLDDERLRRRIARRARGLVDGRGAWRVASALRDLVTAS